jgi:glycosyltransferase involved in cell wall biosynthesis
LHVAFVTPAVGRFAVTRLALAQRANLRDELALRGVTATCVVIADDENLDIAREYGFDTIERENVLGRKVNAGFELAGKQGADYIAFIGSDDWMHPDLFSPLGANRVYAGHEITVIDLLTGQAKHLGWRHRHGVPPWFIPSGALERCNFRPCEDVATEGMEFQIGRWLGDLQWYMHDPHPMTRVDFKSDEGLTSYEQITRAVAGKEGKIGELEHWYSSDLVNMALALRDEFILVTA